jgi:hypothetical protein
VQFLARIQPPFHFSRCNFKVHILNRRSPAFIGG